jgi:hypothetical protein
VTVGFNPLEFEVDKFCGVKRTSLLEFRHFHGGSRAVEVGVGTQASYPSADQVEPNV